jgi:hypothetical protein
MSHSTIESYESIENDEEKELFIHKDIFDLVKDFFESDSSSDIKNYHLADLDSNEKSFETSHKNSTQNCLIRHETKKKIQTF